MSLRLGDTAPDFTAETTEGTIHFHRWIEGCWAVLFSHPKDFTPVCITELGKAAKLKAEEDCIIVPSVKDEDIKEKFPKGYNRIKPYLRTTFQPNI